MPTIRFPSPPFGTAARRRCVVLSPPVLGTFLVALLVAGGCAAPETRDDDAPFELAEDYTEGVVSYTVQRGDRLGDIALEFTGDVSRWREIAASNGIDDPRSLRAGAVLRIPASLIPGYADRIAARTAGAGGTANGAAPETPAEPGRPEDAVAAVAGPAARTGAGPGGAEPPVELSPVDVNRRFDLAPLDGEVTPVRRADDAGATLDARDIAAPPARRVRVVGSYTPKGVYAQPAAYSRLLMRVAPGTEFDLDGEIGDWYGVVTPDGVGYLRDADARIVDDELGARTASSGLVRG